jgi:hypothetical protein
MPLRRPLVYGQRMQLALRRLPQVQPRVADAALAVALFALGQAETWTPFKTSLGHGSSVVAAALGAAMTLPLAFRPFFIQPIDLKALRARGAEILDAIRAATPSGARAYAPFYGYGEADELRPTQYYLNKLPRAVAELLPEVDVFARPATSRAEAGLGMPWREPWVTETGDRSRNVEVDVEVVERGLRGHVETEHALAAALRELGIEPRSPTAGEPSFDIAWTYGATTYVAEVKSTTDRNEERQLRLGLGQVLRYRSVLSEALGRPVSAVLVPERAPWDPTWESTCASVGVALVPRDQLGERLGRFIDAGRLDG